MTPQIARAYAAVLMVLTAGMMLAGCSTTPPVDWNGRIGTYTYDQTVQELGPPISVAKLDDGGRVAEWFVKQRAQRNVGVGLGVGSYGPSSSVGVGVSRSRSSPPQSDYLRLTFDAEGTLKQVDNITR